MKSVWFPVTTATLFVAPYAGAWIEMFSIAALSSLMVVAPYAGAWIEIMMFGAGGGPKGVAPYAGAWIEIVWRLNDNTLR